jgi:hypothetical protein
MAGGSESGTLLTLKQVVLKVNHFSLEHACEPLERRPFYFRSSLLGLVRNNLHPVASLVSLARRVCTQA